MELVNLANGKYIDTIQWTLHNAKDIKKYLDECIENYTWDIDEFLRAFDENGTEVDLHCIPAINNSLDIYFEDEYKHKKHVISVPAYSYILFEQNDDMITTVSEKDIKGVYGKPKITEKELINNKSGIHYFSYLWSGSFASFSRNLSDELINVSTFYNDDDKALHIRFGKHKTLLVKTKSWVLVPVGKFIDDGLMTKKMEVVTPNELKKNYHTLKANKLPKYVFTATETTGDYSDAYTQVLGTSPTYSGAQDIIDKADDLHTHMHDTFDDYENTTYDITTNKTHLKDINKNDV